MIKIFFILNRKVTPQKNRCVGCWLLALPRAQMTRLSRILGIWFTYYVPVLINFMTPSKHLSIAYQGINLRRLLRFFFLSKAPHAVWKNAYLGSLNIISWSLCYRWLRDGFNVHFMQKHRKWTARLPLSAGCFLIAQAGFFIWCTTTVGLYWGIIILLKFHVPSRDFFLQSFVTIHCLWKCWR